MNKKLTSMLALAMALLMVVSVFAACQPKEPPVTPATFKQAEYNTTTSVMPSNWNEFTYADNNDTQIMSYIGSSFFEYDYKFEDDKKFNDDGSFDDSDFKLLITNTRIMFMEGSSTPAYITNKSLHITKAVVEEELQQGEFVWKARSNGNLGLIWKGGIS